MNKLLFGLLTFFAANSFATEITYHKDIAKIFHENCIDCHRDSGLNLGGIIAPMALTSYEEVRPWAKSILKEVESKRMPPWHASPEFNGVFANERTLSEEEIRTIREWINYGLSEGDTKNAPELPEIENKEWAIGEPDLIISFPKPFLVEEHIEDLNTNIFTNITPDILPEDEMIVAMEFKPGSEAVHHILGFIIPPKETKEGLQMLGGIAPGSFPMRTPQGYGIKFYTNSRFLFQMHYNKEKGISIEDNSSVAFVFAKEPVHRLYVEAIGDIRSLRIPPNSPDTRIVSRREWNRNFIVAGYAPHMHLRGFYSRYDAVYPNGSKETLLETPNWEFDWQMSYVYPEPRFFPAGTIFEVEMGYNNTAEKRGNPDPNIEVRFGQETKDEMNLGWLTWGYAEPTDNDPVPVAIGGN